MANESASAKLSAASEEAAGIVMDIMRDVAVPPEVRLHTTEAVLRNGELSSRLSQLERAMKEAEELFKWSVPGTQ